jgi:sortase A
MAIATEAPPEEVPDALPAAWADATSDRPSPREAFRTFSEHLVTRLVVAGLLLTSAMFLAFETVGTQLWYDAHQSGLQQDFLTNGTPISKGKSAAVLQIPALNLKLTVIEGDGRAELRNGPGHRRHTPLPGSKGNSVIAGHDARWGAPFHDLPKLKKGALIVAQARLGDPVYYRVVATHKISGSNPGYFGPTDDTRLTLVTGRNGSLSSDRYVVIAVSGKADSNALKSGLPNGVTANGPDGRVGLPLAGLASLLLLGAVAVAAIPLRARYRTGACIVVCTPFVAAGLLALFIQFDALLPTLR